MSVTHAAEAPRVSVIVPAHNAAATLAETLASLTAQTLPAIEVLVVDDASTDGTRDVAARQVAADPRFRLLAFAENRGVAEARNAGLEAARGRWVLFLDSDDWIEPGHLASLVAAAEADPGAMGAFSGYRFAREDGRPGEAIRPRLEGDLFAIMAQRCPLKIHACLVRREAVLAVGGFDPGWRSPRTGTYGRGSPGRAGGSCRPRVRARSTACGRPRPRTAPPGTSPTTSRCCAGPTRRTRACRHPRPGTRRDGRRTSCRATAPSCCWSARRPAGPRVGRARGGRGLRAGRPLSGRAGPDRGAAGLGLPARGRVPARGSAGAVVRARAADHGRARRPGRPDRRAGARAGAGPGPGAPLRAPARGEGAAAHHRAGPRRAAERPRRLHGHGAAARRFGSQGVPR